MKTYYKLLFIVFILIFIIMGCGIFPSTPASNEPQFSLNMQYGKLPYPNYLGMIENSSTLSKTAMPDTVDKARIMVIDNSAYVMWEELTATKDWEDYAKDRDSWKGDLGFWNEWVKLIGNHFTIVANATLEMENGQASGTVNGVIGLNSIIVSFEEGGRIHYWGETRATGVADSTQEVYLFVSEHAYFQSDSLAKIGTQFN